MPFCAWCGTKLSNLANYCHKCGKAVIKEKNVIVQHSSEFNIKGNKLVKYNGNDECVVIPDEVEIIGRGAFFNNRTVKNVILPPGIIIEDEGFKDCDNLENISLDGVLLEISKLGEAAFWGCKGLKTPIVYKGGQLKANAFYKCQSLRSVFLSSGIDLDEGVFRNCENLETVAEGDIVLTLGKLGEGAFFDCRKLRTKIKLTNKYVPANAFYNCKMLESVFVPTGTDLDEFAFQDCENLIRICEDNEIWDSGNIAEGVFGGCSKLKSNIRFSERVVRSNTFYNCRAIKKVFLPELVKIEEYAFQDCENLESIADGDIILSLGRLEDGVFFGCKRLNTKLKLTGHKIPSDAFYDCKELVMVEIPDGTDIYEYAFQDCEDLKTICGNRSLFVAGKLEEGAFWGCKNLAVSIKVTENVVRDNVFYNCESLKEVFLPSNVRIEEYAFDSCDAKHRQYSDLVELKQKLSEHRVYVNTNNAKLGREDEETPLSIDNTIGLCDFMVKTDLYNCRNKGHELTEVSAVVYCLTNNGDVVEKKVMAGYCKTCKRYYILNREYERLKANYMLLCRVIDNSVASSSGTGVFSDLNQESIIKQYGYSVNQQDGLSTTQRQTILELLVEANILTKAEICSHLDWLINSRSYDNKYRAAIEKWTKDRDYIAGYRLSDNRSVIVKKITKGKVK